MHVRRASTAILTLALLAGCSTSGGSQGDANDPTATTDTEQMTDETGDVGNVNGPAQPN